MSRWAITGSGSSRPKRWSTTRSGTRNDRPNNGLSLSSTDTRLPLTSGAALANRLRAHPSMALAPQSSSARPTLARRRVTSSFK